MSNIIKRVFKLILCLAIIFLIASFVLVIFFKWINPSSSAVIIAWEWKSDQHAEHIWQPIENISPALQLAVIASEDQKFPNHFGFDLDSLKKALNEKNGKPRGASTISQQVAKNLFLWNGRSYIRKGLEAWFALLMECFWSKQRILEIYLNIAEFGEGTYGAEAAAQNFYKIKAKNINNWQAGLLAAVLPSPKKMSAKNPSLYVQSRSTEINRSMWKLGGITYLEKLSN
ncbi:MAG: monofunctional biosynthetic peptidoglycan transglycosylase [Cellvibrionaceae bacterium]